MHRGVFQLQPWSILLWLYGSHVRLRIAWRVGFLGRMPTPGNGCDELIRPSAAGRHRQSVTEVNAIEFRNLFLGVFIQGMKDEVDLLFEAIVALFRLRRANVIQQCEAA